MVFWRMMFGEIVGKVGAAWLPVHMEMALTDTVPHPIEAHVFGFGASLFDRVVDDSVSTGIVDFWIGVGGCGQFISSSVTRRGQASWALWKHAPTLTLVAEARTLRMMLLTIWMAPFSFGVGAFLAVVGKELRKKIPPAWERALDSER
jgi:hypothetical protein